MAHMVQKVYEPHTPHDNHKYSSLHECFDDMCKLIGIVPAVFNTICTCKIFVICNICQIYFTIPVIIFNVKNH